MSQTLTVRDEVHEMIDIMSERSLHALRPLLDILMDTPAYDGDDDVLSEDELALLEQCRKDWKEHPETFISVAEYKKKRGFA